MAANLSTTPVTLDEAGARRAFEAWLTRPYHDRLEAAPPHLTARSIQGDCYADATTRRLWDAFRAGAARSTQQPAQAEVERARGVLEKARAVYADTMAGPLPATIGTLAEQNLANSERCEEAEERAHEELAALGIHELDAILQVIGERLA